MFLDTNLQDGSDEDDPDNQRVSQRDIPNLASTSSQFIVLTHVQRTINRSFFEGLIQLKFKAMTDSIRRNFTLDSVFPAFLKENQAMTMLPPEYSFQEHKFVELLENCSDLKEKYFKLKTGKKDKKDYSNPLKSNNDSFAWWLMHATFFIYKKIYRFAMSYSDPKCFLKQFYTNIPSLPCNFGEEVDVFASFCLKYYMKNADCTRSVNRRLGGPKFFFRLSRFVTYVQCDWKMKQLDSIPQLANNQDQEEAATIGDSRIFHQYGIESLHNILYKTKLMKADLDEKGCHTFGYEDLVKIEQPGIMVSGP